MRIVLLFLRPFMFVFERWQFRRKVKRLQKRDPFIY
jgi:hypothetical protein